METIAVGYLRVSTGGQADEGLSLAVQAERIEAYCKAQGWELSAVYEDAGLSGKNMSRPGLLNAMEHIERGDANALVALKMCRVSRAVADWDAICQWSVKQNVRISCVMDSIDTGTANGRLVINLMASIAQWQRDAIAENTRHALALRKSEGRAVGGVPTACVRQGDYIIKTPERVSLERRVRSLRGKGYSFRVIGERVGVSGQTARRIMQGRGDNE